MLTQLPLSLGRCRATVAGIDIIFVSGHQGLQPKGSAASEALPAVGLCKRLDEVWLPVRGRGPRPTSRSGRL